MAEAKTQNELHQEHIDTLTRVSGIFETQNELNEETRSALTLDINSKKSALQSQIDNEVQTLLGTAHSQFSSGFIIPESPIKLAPARRVGAYPYDEATLISDAMNDNSKLPAIQWDNSAGAYVAEGNPTDLYVGAAENMTNVGAIPSHGGDEVPIFWDIPNLNRILPHINHGGMSNGFDLGGRVPALILKLDVGSSYRPHATRRTFIDVIYSRSGQSSPAYHSGGSYASPQVVARNIAVDGKWYYGSYSSIAVIPLSSISSMDNLRIVNNGHIDMLVYSYGFAWINKKQVS